MRWRIMVSMTCLFLRCKGNYTLYSGARRSKKGEISMVMYRPHRGSLNDAMAEMRSFDSIEEMFHYIVEEWKVWGDPFSIGDLVLTYDYGKDERIDWKECRYVCTRRMGEEKFRTPQCIGMCSIEE